MIKDRYYITSATNRIARKTKNINNVASIKPKTRKFNPGDYVVVKSNNGLPQITGNFVRFVDDDHIEIRDDHFSSILLTVSISEVL